MPNLFFIFLKHLQLCVCLYSSLLNINKTQREKLTQKIMYKGEHIPQGISSKRGSVLCFFYLILILVGRAAMMGWGPPPPPPPRPAALANLTTAELQRLEGTERRNVEARLLVSSTLCFFYFLLAC